MSQTVPDFTTVILTISFLIVLGLIAIFIKKKSGHLKNFIKNENNIEIVNQVPLNNGFLAYMFKVGEENFFFVGHKSGRGSLTQIDRLEYNIKKSGNKISDKISSNNFSKQEKSKIEKPLSSKPLQHVNISDLLTAHKKGNKNE